MGSKAVLPCAIAATSYIIIPAGPLSPQHLSHAFEQNPFATQGQSGTRQSGKQAPDFITIEM
jgi:hypothetical protein